MHPLEQDVETLRNEPGEILVQQADPADCVYIIAEGEAEVRLTTDDGHDVRLGTIARHSILGEIAVLCCSRRTATVLAKSRMLTLKIAAPVFVDLLRGNPEISIQVLRIMAERLENLTAMLRRQRRELG
jgi:CRP-like cAMP-binding protein